MDRARTLGLAVALITPPVLGCENTVLVGGPGVLTATLGAPNGAEGVALLHLVGGQISSVEALTGDLHTSVLGDTTKVLVLLDTPGEIDFLLNVADTTLPPVTTIVQVADGQNQVRSSLAEYRVRFTP
jgi:hypothetical protein